MIDEELKRAFAPKPMNPIGIGWAGPTLLVAGTPEQQQRYLPGPARRLRDLVPAVQRAGGRQRPRVAADDGGARRRRVRAQRPEDLDDAGAVRPLRHPARPHRSGRGAAPGISYFVLDMQSPGITIRPIKQMDHEATFNEVFFDNVRIPAADIVGTENDGWRLAKVTLGNERVSLSGEGALWGIGPTAHDLLDLVRGERDRHRPGAAPAARRALHRVRGAAADPAAHRLGEGPGARARPRGVGAQGARRRARPARHGDGRRARGQRRACCSTRARSAPTPPMWAKGYLYSRALDHRRRHQRGAAQHPRRAHPRPPPRRLTSPRFDQRHYRTRLASETATETGLPSYEDTVVDSMRSRAPSTGSSTVPWATMSRVGGPGMPGRAAPRARLRAQGRHENRRRRCDAGDVGRRPGQVAPRASHRG